MVASNQYQSNTGTQDQQYDLVSILYHALQSCSTYEQYLRDAEQEGDEELADFFRDVHAEDRHRAERAKALLKSRM